jgi:hypothetical protein
MHGMITSQRYMRLMGNEFVSLGEQALFKGLERDENKCRSVVLGGEAGSCPAHIAFLLRFHRKPEKEINVSLNMI